MQRHTCRGSYTSICAQSLHIAFNMRKVLAFILVLFIALSFTGCSGDDGGSTPTANTGAGLTETPTVSPGGSTAKTGDELKDFLAETAGIWYCHGNLSGAILEVLEDGTWIHTESGETSEGVVMYDEDDGLTFAVPGSSATGHYSTFPVENGVLIFKSYNYYQQDDSIDISSLNGNWYLNGDNESDLFDFSDGKWRFIDNTNDFAYTVRTGYLEWNAAKSELEAYEYYDEPPFSIFTISGGTLKKGSDSYELLEDGADTDSYGNDYDGTEASERITFITQLYDGQNIVEIPYFEYEGTNPEFDAINTLFNQGYQAQYEEFLKNKEDFQWIEIKSYPFTTPNYLQVVISKITYPSYGTAGDLESINYDRVSGRWLTNEDALEMIGLSEDDVFSGISEVFVPDIPGEMISDIKIAGFLIHESIDGEQIALLLELTAESIEESLRKSFYLYYPNEGDDANYLWQLDNYCLFDPYDLDQMDPPLWYQQMADLPQYLSIDYLIEHEWVNIENGEKMVFEADRFIELNDSWNENPEGIFYSYTDDNVILFFLDGGHLNDYYFEFDPDTQILYEIMHDEVQSRWRTVGG